MKKKIKKTGLLSMIGGFFSSLLGVLGICFVCPPICGGLCITGPLVAIFGVGIAGFFYKYGYLFIIIGAVFFITGIYLIIKKGIIRK